MPLVDYNVESTWQAAYYGPPSEYTGVPVMGHYERSRKSVILGNDHWLLRTALGIANTDTLLLVGAGYGWIKEDWMAAGHVGLICAVDTSPYIHATKATHAIVPVENETLTSNASRNRVKTILGITGNNKVRWSITEDVLPGLTDAECVQMGTTLRDMSTTVAHWVSTLETGGVPNPALAHNWKTTAEWKALMTPDLIVRRGDGVAI